MTGFASESMSLARPKSRTWGYEIYLYDPVYPNRVDGTSVFPAEDNGKDLLAGAWSIRGLGTPVQCHGAKTHPQIADPYQAYILQHPGQGACLWEMVHRLG